MVFMFQFAILVAVLRKVLRTGVLWLLRNPNDPSFNPIQDMVRTPLPFVHTQNVAQQGRCAHLVPPDAPRLSACIPAPGTRLCCP